MRKMTAKRFILKENGLIDDTQLKILLDGGEDKEDMVDLLNELHEENEQLKESVYSWSKSYNRVYEENERFKFILQEAIRTERTDIGKNVLKQLADNLGVKYE